MNGVAARDLQPNDTVIYQGRRKKLAGAARKVAQVGKVLDGKTSTPRDAVTLTFDDGWREVYEGFVVFERVPS